MNLFGKARYSEYGELYLLYLCIVQHGIENMEL